MKMKLTYPVTLTHHGAYKEYNRLTLWLEKFINDNWELIREGFELPEELHIRLRPRPCGKYLGLAYSDSNKIELNVARSSKRRIISTLFHELRHMHQYATKMLTFQVRGKGLDRIWNGVNFGRGLVWSASKSKEYDSQPWEADAIAVQEPNLKRLDAALPGWDQD